MVSNICSNGHSGVPDMLEWYNGMGHPFRLMQKCLRYVGEKPNSAEHPLLSVWVFRGVETPGSLC